MKVVINTCYGGFGLSDEALAKYKAIKGITEEVYYWNIERDDPALVQVVEEMGDAAAGSYAYLKIVNIPDDVQWYIEEDDGMEWVAETHRTWQ